LGRDFTNVPTHNLLRQFFLHFGSQNEALLDGADNGLSVLGSLVLETIVDDHFVSSPCCIFILIRLSVSLVHSRREFSESRNFRLT
jgi:hypothetical protein